MPDRSIGELKDAIAGAEARGDWRTAMALKKEWFGRIVVNSDGRTPAEETRMDEQMKRSAGRADKPSSPSS